MDNNLWRRFFLLVVLKDLFNLDFFADYIGRSFETQLRDGRIVANRQNKWDFQRVLRFLFHPHQVQISVYLNRWKRFPHILESIRRNTRYRNVNSYHLNQQNRKAGIDLNVPVIYRFVPGKTTVSAGVSVSMISHEMSCSTAFTRWS